MMNRRRTTITALCLLLALTISAWADQQVVCAPAATLLWYQQPAAKWDDALPVGNGRLVTSLTVQGAEPKTGSNTPTAEKSGAAGHDPSGKPRWSHDFKEIKPLAGWKDNMGCVTMTYNAPLKKYIMCVTDGGNTVDYFNTYILESDHVTGPWKLVTYLKHFGQQAYFVNIPSKFISKDGRTMWLCYSANFAAGWGKTDIQSRPEGSKYAMCLQEVKLLVP